MDKFSPIALFTYNRLNHLKKTIDALKKNFGSESSDLYIFSDGAKTQSDKTTIEQIRDYLKSIDGFKSVELIESKENKGLANSIISGVSYILQKSETVIVLEDDLITSPYFLLYMNEALKHYSLNNVWSIAGYCPPIKLPQDYKYSTFLSHRNCSWGWATWKQNWIKTTWQFETAHDFFADRSKRKVFERGGNDLSMMLLKQQKGVINSWSIRFNFAAFTHSLPTVYPSMSLVKNQGVDGSGTNMRQSNKYLVKLNSNKVAVKDFNMQNEIHPIIAHRFRKFYNTSLFRRFINSIKMKIYLFQNH